MIADEPAAELHYLGKVHLIAIRRLPRVFPHHRAPVGEYIVTESPPLGGLICPHTREEAANSLASVQHATIGAQQVADERTLKRRVFCIKGHCGIGIARL